MAGYGVSCSLLSSAQSALLPAMVPADLLGAANSALQTLAQGLRLITPQLGAGLLAWLGPRCCSPRLLTWPAGLRCDQRRRRWILAVTSNRLQG